MSEEESIKQPKQKRKSVGFAPLPEEDLKEHHRELKKKEQERLKSHPFHKIPPELSHLEEKPAAPRPLHVFEEVYKKKKSSKAKHLSDLKDLQYVSVKDISVQNKKTELNFHYPSIDLPIPANQVLVDIKYASLNSYDLAKINQYLLNVSNTKVGLGYEFAGEVIMISPSLKNSEYNVGDAVFGIINPLDKKGTLSTAQLINPSKDVLIKAEDSVLEKLKSIDVELSFNKTNEIGEFEIASSSSDSEIEDPITSEAGSKLASLKIEEDLPPLAKLSTFPVLYSRAKQVLDHSQAIFESTGKANILINGADTNLGFTLLQLLNSSIYAEVLNHLNLILVIRESSHKHMRNLIDHFTKGKYYDPSKVKKIHLIPFDMVNEDLVLPGEKVQINYKKLDFFASEIFDALFSTQTSENGPIDETNINHYKLDLIVDIIGSKKNFQSSSVRIDRIDSLNLPLHAKISENASLTKLFNGKVKEPFLVKILKPKSLKSAFISCCKFNLSEPSYDVDKLINYSGNETKFSPWSMKWSSDLVNNSFLAKYNYYEELDLKISSQWIMEGLKLLIEDQLKFRIDEFTDWRNNFRKYIKLLKNDDGKIIFKVEDF